MRPAALFVVASLALPLTAAAQAPAAQASDPLVIQVSPEVDTAVRALGSDVRFFTARARPLARLEEITAPESQVATANLGLARGIQGLLRAAGVKLAGGAYGVARLTSPHHFATAFRGDAKRRLLLVRSGAEGIDRIVLRGGGRPLMFAIGGQRPAGVEPGRTPAAAAGPAATSFGPLVAAALADNARLRHFQPADVEITERKARPGQRLLVLKIGRDFGAGLGTISFLFGSGFLVEPDFAALVLTSAGGRRHALVGTHAEGPRLELVYEVPRGARQLTLIEGDGRWPLDPLLSAQAAN